ncbi:methyltransferase domain-containing protein [Embleya sp. NPDC050493]|uniref:methyltransferase domain-containing protein n=1 Tax=Embleya sp. NPDC050493 TaxID=3363989 RepID=UPI0037AA8F39
MTTGIARLLADAGALPPGWQSAFDTVRRADFLPARFWAWCNESGYTPLIDRNATGEWGRQAWDRAADEDLVLVTQWDDGDHTGDVRGDNPTSSASAPAAVARMLDALDIHGGEAVLEVGTGTGYTAALLAARGCRVTTIEVDAELAERARKNLARAGYRGVVVLTGDGALGHPGGGPYDRIHVTAGVRHTPGAWLEQTRPGGLIVMPWGTYYAGPDWTTVLTVHGAHYASGPFTDPLAFMKLRAQRARWPRTSFPPGWMDTARVSEPDIDIADITGGLYDPVEFVIGLHVPQCVPQRVDHPESVNLWLYGADTGDGESIAVAAFGDGYNPQALQAGPRDLWGEVQTAYHRWADAGKPAADRFGLTVVVDADGTVEQRPWYEAPDRELPPRLRNTR